MTDTVESDCTGSAGCQNHPCLGQIRSSHTLDLCTTDRIAYVILFDVASPCALLGSYSLRAGSNALLRTHTAS